MTPEWNALPFAERVIAWQRSHGRAGLPWQQTRDPYRVWLSEIMLQQTQVTTVLGYYDRFLQRFPTVAALAAAPSEEVLAMWSGLGYYARARNLHKCAQAVASDHGGQFPHSAAQLAELPGIGRSTAAAIAAFCFGERVAILDGNVKRVLTRLLAYEGDIAQAASGKALWAIASDLLPDAPAGAPLHAAMATYTQGLMDLGATVCTIRKPACDACPAHAMCAGRAAGNPEKFPVKTRKLKRSKRAAVLLWLQHENRVWLVRRADSGVWAQLWSLPEFDTAIALERAVEDWPGTLEWMAPFKHVLTHFDWMLQPLKLQWHGAVSEAQQREIERLGAVNVASAAGYEPGEADVHSDVASVDDDADASVPVAVSEGRWFGRDDLLGVGIPSPIRKLLDALP
ncbi:MAG: A/G-specific adenine glycosylase [Pseudomonadota bacterium]|nr:A/G-specific adenine glycosylase [Pseudomonadota bacterium]